VKPETRLDADLRSWLQADQHEDGERVLFVALQRLDDIRQRQRSWVARRFSSMNSNRVRFGIAAAAIVAAALSMSLLPNLNTGDQRSGSPRPSPTPLALSGSDGQVPLEGGRYTAWLSGVSGGFYDVDLTIPAGWVPLSVNGAKVQFVGTWGALYPFLEVFSVRGVYDDPCHPKRGSTAAVNGSITQDQLEHALAHRVGFDSPPINTVVVNGKTAMHMVIPSEIGILGESCLSLFVTEPEPSPSAPQPSSRPRTPYAPSPTDKGDGYAIWVLPADGDHDPLVVVGRVSEGTVKAEQNAALEEIVSSLSYTWRER
jgi:hypothetical protein